MNIIEKGSWMIRIDTNGKYFFHEIESYQVFYGEETQIHYIGNIDIPTYHKNLYLFNNGLKFITHLIDSKLTFHTCQINVKSKNIALLDKKVLTSIIRDYNLDLFLE